MPPPSESNRVKYKPHQKKKALKAMFLGPNQPLDVQTSDGAIDSFADDFAQAMHILDEQYDYDV
jgi:hypothetical protein